MGHSVAAGAGGWTRIYELDASSNRLAGSWQAGDRLATEVRYAYDTHGNALNLAHGAVTGSVRWDHRDLLHSLDLGGGGSAFYQHDHDGRRVRKRIERLGGDVEERVYLPGFERYRRWVAGRVVEETQTTHLFAGDRRVLLVDDVIGREKPAPAARPASAPSRSGCCATSTRTTSARSPRSSTRRQA